MNIELTLRKLDGHSTGLLTFYLGVLRKYSILDPMIFDEGVCKGYGSNKAVHGFSLLRSTLFYGVAHDIANIVFDKGKSNPSIFNIVSTLENDAVISKLRDRFAIEFCPREELREFFAEREIENRRRFDMSLDELRKQAGKILSSEEFLSAKNVRDEFTAHLDLQFIDGKYEYPDISKYNLKWNSAKSMLAELKPVIANIGFVVRNAGFAWEAFKRQNRDLSTSFWSQPC